MRRRTTRSVLAGATSAALVAGALLLVPLTASASDEPLTLSVRDAEAPEIVPVTVDTRERLSELGTLGVDLGEDVTKSDTGFTVQAVVTPEQQAQLRAQGVRVGPPAATAEDYEALQEEYRTMSAAVAAAEAEAASSGDELRVQRAQWFDDPQQGRFLEVEVWSETGATSAGLTVTVTFDAGPGTEIGGPGTQSFALSRFVDAGQYMFHRANSPVKITTAAAPTRMRVESVLAGEVVGSTEVAVRQTLTGSDPQGPGAPREQDPTYESSFIDRYVDSTEAYAAIEELAAEFPHLAEVVDLPHKTNGYRRKAMAVLGAPGTGAAGNASRVAIDSRDWGHQGGNGITVAAVGAGAPLSPLSVDVDGRNVTVTLGTDASGAPVSTAAQVAQALNDSPAASALLTATTFRGSAGAGVLPATARQTLSDFLSAPDRVSREPMTVKAIRIGKHRDGSRVGVLGYSQEHAREWVTPLVALESAERLLRNYDNDVNTKRLVDDLDIFIIPSVNPDGTHYSMHDFTLQRRNLTRHCGPGAANDLHARNAWGVDLNRNFTVGSVRDGYAGASTSCTSDTFAGPEELSEPEAKNEVWLAEQNPNIKFSMNIHSHGGYFMWAPGAYRTAGREGLPRPSYGTERFFYEASSHILNRIKEHRGTNIWDARVGPISDVLYSAAGNSGDELYYNRGIFAWSFEVGAPRRNGADTGWTSVGFTPPYAEGYEEAMEFSNGLIGMFEVARLYARDTVKPTASLTPGRGPFPGPTRFTFDVSEPADVYYTTDGSRPTLASPRLEYQGPRQGEASFVLDRSATVKWFSVDARGNVEGGYDPAGNGQNFRQAKVTIH